MVPKAWEGPHSPSPVAVPDEEVITTQGWKRNQGCLEGIKEWENRIQAASWPSGHITAFGHSFQMPCIFQCAATFSIPSLGAGGGGAQFKVLTSQHNSVFKRGIEKSWERESTAKSGKKKKKKKRKWKLFSLVQLFGPHGLYSPWNSLGQNTGVGSLSCLQGIFPTQGLNPDLLHYRRILYQLRSPRILEWVAYPFSSGSSQPRDWTRVYLHCRWILYQLSYCGNPKRDLKFSQYFEINSESSMRRHGFLGAMNVL